MTQENAHRLYGDTERSSCVPDFLILTNEHSTGTTSPKDSLTNANLPGAPSSGHLPMSELLADVLIIWDCYAGEPWVHSPLLLRFERTDLLVVAKDVERITLFEGSVDTQADPCTVLQACRMGDASANHRATSRISGSTRKPNEAISDSDEELCLTWDLARPLAHLIGLCFSGLAGIGSDLAIELEGYRLLLRNNGGKLAQTINPPAESAGSRDIS